jgi:hypothetical protein
MKEIKQTFNSNIYKRNIAYMILSISILYTIATIIWVLKEPPIVLTCMEILTMFGATIIVYYMVILYCDTDEQHKKVAFAAVICAMFMAVITIVNHFIYITVFSKLYSSIQKMPTVLRLDAWPSVPKALECVSWGLFLGISEILASFAIHKENEKIISKTLLISGIVILCGLLGPITGYMNLYFLSTAGYTIGLIILAITYIVLDIKSNR